MHITFDYILTIGKNTSIQKNKILDIVGSILHTGELEYWMAGHTGWLDTLDSWTHWIAGHTGELDTLDGWTHWVAGHT